MVHVIEKLATIFGKPLLSELTSTTLDPDYGVAISTTFGTATKINAVILKDANYFMQKLHDDWGIQVKNTPSVVIPESNSIRLGSRITDATTGEVFEVINQEDIVIHPKTSIRDKISYREYALRKIQEKDGQGI